MSGDREREKERSSIGSVPVSFIFVNASFFPQLLSPADVLYESEFICLLPTPLV